MNATVATSKRVNFAQLAAEMGGAQLSGVTVASNQGEQGTTITCHDAAVSQAALQAAVDAHVAIDERANRTTIEEQAATALANNRAFLALNSPTNAQNLAQVRALTRQNNALIRLALGRFDSAD